jgi:hypothetical protein
MIRHGLRELPSRRQNPGYPMIRTSPIVTALSASIRPKKGTR